MISTKSFWDTGFRYPSIGGADLNDILDRGADRSDIRDRFAKEKAKARMGNAVDMKEKDDQSEGE
jgi:hypothetical protein